MKEGYEVSLLAHGEEIIVRTVVAVDNGYIYVCRKEEFELSKREQREPVSIGFRAEYLRGSHAGLY